MTGGEGGVDWDGVNMMVKINVGKLDCICSAQNQLVIQIHKFWFSTIRFNFNLIKLAERRSNNLENLHFDIS